MTSWATTEIRRRLRRAIRQGGLKFGHPANEAYLAHRIAVAKPFATEIVRRLESHRPPETFLEISLLRNVPIMTAAACTATDCLYRLMARLNRHRNDIRRCLSVFMIGSAVFDHICDESPSLFPILVERITEERLRLTLGGGKTPSFTQNGDPGLIGYVTLLVEDETRLCRKLFHETGRPETTALWQAFIETIIQLHRAELLSRSDSILEGDLADAMQRVWTAPLWAGALLIALTPDVRPKLNLEDIRDRIDMMGRLFCLVDDIVDLEGDWSTGSRNSLLDAVRPFPAPAGGSVELPWNELLSDRVCRPYMAEVTSLVSSLSDARYREDLTGWLFSWLSG